MITLQDQLNLEQESINRGVENYRRKVNNTPLAELSVGIQLLRNSIEPLIRAVNVYINTPIKGKGNKIPSLLKSLEIGADEIAYITLRACFQATLSERPKSMLTPACSLVSSMILDHHEYTKFKRENPSYLFKLEQDLKTSGTAHKRTVIMLKKRKLGITDTELSMEDRIVLGQKLINLLLMASPDLFQKVHVGKGKDSERWYLEGTPITKAWIDHQHDMCEVLTPFYLPMLLPPQDCTSPDRGGYFSAEMLTKVDFIKTRNKSALEALRKHEMSEVYSAVNSLQKTAWRVNSKLLEVLREVWDSNATLGDLPSRVDDSLPPKLWSTKEEGDRFKEEHPEEFIKWKREMTKAYEANKRLCSKRISITNRIKLAEKFAAYEQFYYPYCLDFRGRVYPIPTTAGMNPQGDDSGKALLEFTEGKALGERGVFWLAVHVANTYGFDKCSFEDRVKWVKEHEAHILDSAVNPLDGARFWCKADSPYCFLAACFEWAEYKKQGDGFKSHIPIAMDGTCNGLQNFSAMLLDEVGGNEVNLIPRDKPGDIYSKVAALVSEKVAKEAMEGNETAALWIGKIDRKMAKRNVMTLPYGAKKFGFKDQLMAELEDREERYLDTDNYFAPAVYLADRMYHGIGEVVIAARAAMDWLQEVSKTLNKAKVPIQWVTPVGFLAHQEYFLQESVRVATFWGELKYQPQGGVAEGRIDLNLKKPTTKLNCRKQSSGISPNFVHSMDACHLMTTTNRCVAAGINSFAMIHDSYGTHAADIDTMHRELREAFIQIYTDHDVLEEFRSQVISQIPEDLHKDIPPVPPKGNLKLAQVRDSRYFFA